jgi:hypothetical protein
MTAFGMKLDHWLSWTAAFAGPVVLVAVEAGMRSAHYYAGLRFGIFCEHCWDLRDFDAPLA